MLTHISNEELGSDNRLYSKQITLWIPEAVQGFFNQVVRFMTERGSPLRLLTIRPPKHDHKHPAWDFSGFSLNSTYTKGYMTDSRGIRTVVAVPLKLAKKEMAKEAFML